MRTAAARHRQFGIGNLLRHNRLRLGLTPALRRAFDCDAARAVRFTHCWLCRLPMSRVSPQFVTRMRNCVTERALASSDLPCPPERHYERAEHRHDPIGQGSGHGEAVGKISRHNNQAEPDVSERGRKRQGPAIIPSGTAREPADDKARDQQNQHPGEARNWDVRQHTELGAQDEARDAQVQRVC